MGVRELRSRATRFSLSLFLSLHECIGLVAVMADAGRCLCWTWRAEWWGAWLLARSCALSKGPGGHARLSDGEPGGYSTLAGEVLLQMVTRDCVKSAVVDGDTKGMCLLLLGVVCPSRSLAERAPFLSLSLQSLPPTLMCMQNAAQQVFCLAIIHEVVCWNERMFIACCTGCSRPIILKVVRRTPSLCTV